jgi:Carboxypeptidase regulatory-like domain
VRIPFLAFAAFWLCGPVPVLAAPVRIDFTEASKLSQPPLSLEVRIWKNGAPVETAERRSSPWGQPLQLDLEAGAWSITAAAPKTWSPTVNLVVSKSASTVRIPVYPAARMQGQLKVPAGQTLPSTLQVALKAAPAGGGGDALNALCPVIEQGRFACDVPAGTFDLRLRTEGYISQFRWGIRLSPEAPLSWGTIELQPGASVTGWVEAEGGKPLSPECRVTLASFGADVTAETVRRDGAIATLSAPVNERGFFHFDGMAPGKYTVTASQPGFAPADATVQVLAGREADLIQPLVMTPPLEVEISVDPIVDPSGQAWRLQLYKLTPGFRQMKDLGQREVPPAGLLRWPGLSKGMYALSVLRSDGVPWHREEVTLENDGTPIAIRVDIIQLEGRLTLGGEPVMAALVFGGARGASRQRFDSDEKGEFSGPLPHAGEWPVEVRGTTPAIEVFLPKVAVEPLKGERRAHVEIELPNTRLRGRVVDDKRRPVPAAFIDVTPVQDPGNRGVQKLVGSGGEFEIFGLPEGMAVVEASSREGTSEQLYVRLEEDTDPPDVELVIRKLRRIDGRVLSPGGAVPGASLMIGPVQQEVMALPTRFTGPEGEFRTEVPENTREIFYWLSAPGFAFRFGRMRLPDPSQELVLQVNQAGGALNLDLSAPADDELLVLAHGGGFLPGLMIERWGSIHGSARKMSDRLLWTGMEPGLYSLCRSSSRTFPSLKARGFTGPECVAGELDPGGSLTLSAARAN